MARPTYVVPAGTKAKPCAEETCKKPIYFAKKVGLPDEKLHPMDCDEKYGGKAPTDTEDGVGVSHFGTCTRPQRFARR
jgi:hypothetical protein